MEKFLRNFIRILKTYKFAIIAGILAIVLISWGLVHIVLNVVFFVLMVAIGFYLDQNYDKVKGFFKSVEKDEDQVIEVVQEEIDLDDDADQ